MNCKRCGAELEAGARFCPACGALQPMICPHCGAESRPGSRSCAACGKKLPMAERENKLVYTKRKKHTGAIIATVIGVLCALLLLGGAVMLLLDNLDFGKQETLQAPEQEQQEQAPAPEEVPVISVQPEVPRPEQETEPVEEEPAVEEEAPPAEEEAPPVEEEAPPAEEEAPPAEEEEPPVEEEEPSVDSEWIFSDSSERLLTEADIEGLSSWELKVARNEIYARHGRKFTSADLKAHFEGCSWYTGTIAPENFSDTMLSKTELANVQFLKAAE